MKIMILKLNKKNKKICKKKKIWLYKSAKPVEHLYPSLHNVTDNRDTLKWVVGNHRKRVPQQNT